MTYKYFKNDAGDVYAFAADGSDDEFINDVLVEMSSAEIDAHLNPPPSADDIRALRDRMLTELDSVVGNPLRWASFDDEQRAELAKYRQALLDVPQQPDFPTSITWPHTPDFL